MSKKKKDTGGAGPVPAGRAMQHRLGDFLFDGAVLAKEEELPAHEEKGSDLKPIRMFPGKDAILASAIVLPKGLSLGKLSDEDLARTGKRWQSHVLPAEAQVDTAYYRWQNRDTSTIIPQAKKPPQFVLVEESRLQELARFETTLRREQELIADSTNGEMKAATIFDHKTLDPRVPSAGIKKAMQSLADNRLKFLAAEWDKLLVNWIRHAAHYGFNSSNVFRAYADASSEALARELSNSSESWLLKACPSHEQLKKIKAARSAAQSFRQRYDRDTMLFEDDRSFLVGQAFEANARALDYKRYCELADIFGPMPKDEWNKAASRPGLQLYIRATVNATKIQRVWDVYWSTYKLHRFIAARRVQTKFRAWYAFKSLHPLVIMRLRFGKRTYYFWCWAQWKRYNYLVKSIRVRLEYIRTYWRNLCFRNWRAYSDAKLAKKRKTLERFRARFDARAGCFIRMKLFTAKSKRIKCWLRRTWNVPQFTLWMEYVAIQKRRRELMKVIVPVQAFVRMVQRRRFYCKLRKARPFLQKFVMLLYCKSQVHRSREEQVLTMFESWGPEELNRREVAKEETERRRLGREKQVAEEKAQSALVELRRHLRSGSGKVQLKQDTKDFLVRQAHSVSKRRAKEAVESDLLARCFAANMELNTHEYRIGQAPHIVCADPTCKNTFWSDKAYRDHIGEMCKEAEDDKAAPVDAKARLQRRGSAMLAKEETMKKAKDAGLAAATNGKKSKGKKNAGVKAGKRHAPIAAQDAQAAVTNVREHSPVDFADLHLMLRAEGGREAIGAYLCRRFGVGPLLNTVDCWTDIQSWRKTSAHSPVYTNRALFIFENYLRPDGARPLEIDLEDGDMRDDFDEDDDPSHIPWFETLLAKFASIKDRSYDGFYQAGFAKNFLHRLFGMKGRKFQMWTENKQATPDMFDGVEFACLIAVHRMLWQNREEHSLFLASREYARFAAAETAYSAKKRLQLLEDCREARRTQITQWCQDFKAQETVMRFKAYEVVDLVLEQEVERILARGISVGTREKVFRLQHDQQSVYEENMAMCDDAVDWAADVALNHVFEFYAVRLLNTMLTHDDMVEGMMEYAGMLRGKRLKKHLDIAQAPVGVRVDMTWFKDSLRDSILEDQRTCPRDYLGCVRLLQRWFRGIIGRNRARKLFISTWAKKWDPQRERFYYVNLLNGDIDWVRPWLFNTLYPHIKTWA